MNTTEATKTIFMGHMPPGTNQMYSVLATKYLEHVTNPNEETTAALIEAVGQFLEALSHAESVRFQLGPETVCPVEHFIEMGEMIGHVVSMAITSECETFGLDPEKKYNRHMRRHARRVRGGLAAAGIDVRFAGLPPSS